MGSLTDLLPLFLFVFLRWQHFATLASRPKAIHLYFSLDVEAGRACRPATKEVNSAQDTGHQKTPSTPEITAPAVSTNPAPGNFWWYLAGQDSGLLGGSVKIFTGCAGVRYIESQFGIQSPHKDIGVELGQQVEISSEAVRYNCQGEAKVTQRWEIIAKLKQKLLGGGK